MAFKKANKHESKLRLALVGPSGSGKTYTALSIAGKLGSGARVAVIDTERGSASKYADLFDFDVMELHSYHPQEYINAIAEAVAGRYDVVIIDSLSHAWNGKDGALDLVDQAQKKAQSGNSFAAWRHVTPLHNALVDAILSARLHVIVTMRAKTEYVMEEDSRGKKAPRKVGLAPVQRDGIEYEFDVVGDINLDHELMVSKSRCPALSGKVITDPGANIAATLNEWLQGAPVASSNAMLTADEIDAIDTLSKVVYGDKWQDKLVELTSHITRGFTGDHTTLTAEEGLRLLTGLQKKHDELKVNGEVTA